MQQMYLCIDLKTFFASVECVERGLDPFSTCLVVADPARGKGSICLAVTPKMKMLGVRNRCRVYEIPPTIKYITAVPRMKKYIEYAANVYSIYLKYISKDDIHVYSIDEAFLDVTKYLSFYHKNAEELANLILNDIYKTYGLTATAGIGTNLYLTKIALDITAKHSLTNIGYLDEEKYQKELWHHKPLTDFWQVGIGTERRLNKLRLYDMYDVAHADTKRLFKEFGINAELLIDHAWGRENCTIKDIKNYKPKNNSLSNSQVLFRDYSFSEARIVLNEMVEMGSLRLIESNLVTDCVGLYIGYSKDMLSATKGTERLLTQTNIYTELSKAFMKIYDTKVDRNLPIRRIGITFSKVTAPDAVQLNLFVNQEQENKERKIELAINSVKSKMGKNAILRGMNLQECATAMARNKMIGGHNSE
ncbi:MAG: DNA repair protein [Clostridia bacterium]|nr:DNA repair protein [Clostridia bacterium]